MRTVEVYENERRLTVLRKYSADDLFPLDYSHYSDEYGTQRWSSLEEVPLPDRQLLSQRPGRAAPGWRVGLICARSGAGLFLQSVPLGQGGALSNETFGGRGDHVTLRRKAWRLLASSSFSSPPQTACCSRALSASRSSSLTGAAPSAADGALTRFGRSSR